MSNNAVHAGFRAMLEAVDPRPSVIRYFGESYAAEDQGDYIAERFAVTQWASRTVGAGGPLDVQGTYTIDLRVRRTTAGLDIYKLLGWHEAILRAFQPGKAPSGVSPAPGIIEAIPAGPLNEEAHVLVSTTIRWERFPTAAR